VNPGRLHNFFLLLQQKFFQPNRSAFDFSVELLHVLKTRPVNVENVSSKSLAEM
jgi:hypothetical protein